jgi:hypothetical protein
MSEKTTAGGHSAEICAAPPGALVQLTPVENTAEGISHISAESRAIAQMAFRVFDADNSGSITVSELRSVFSIMGERTTHAECKEIAEKYGSATRTTYKSIDFDGFCRMICAHRCNEEDASGPCKVEPRAGDDGAVFDLDLEETANLEFNRSLLDHLKNAVARLTPKQLRVNPETETQRFSWLLDGKVKKTLFVLCGDRVIYSWPATQEHSISEWSKTGKVWTAKALTDGTQASLWEPRASDARCSPSPPCRRYRGHVP